MDTNHNHTRLDKDEPQIEEDQRIEEKVREFERRNENGMNDADRWRDMHGFEGYSNLSFIMAFKMFIFYTKRKHEKTILRSIWCATMQQI